MPQVKRFLLALALFLAVLPQAALAQDAARVTLRSVDTAAFPTITGYFEARDASGTRLSSLRTEDVQVLEDGVPLPVQQLRSLQLSLRVILAISPAEAFNIRDAEARTRFDYVKGAVHEWAATLSRTSDTLLTLVTPEGTLVNNSVVSEWLDALDAYAPSPALNPSVQVLAQALALATQPAADGGSAVIWWVTATPRLADMEHAAQWQAQLNELGIPLVIWQIDSPAVFENEASQALQSLADGSTGQRVTFFGAESLSSPEPFFSPLRTSYFFQYHSQLRRTGEHELVLQVLEESAAASSDPYVITLDIRPPNPVLVSPPGQIERGPSEQDPLQLSPFSQPIELLVEFPDGFQRNLVRSSLYVDDELVAENTTAPFNHFAWDLSPYRESQQVFLRAEVQDELGLVGSSIEFPVEFSVQAPASWFQALLSRAGTTLALSVVLIAAGAFFLVMVLSGRLAPARLNRIFSRDRGAPPRPAADPLHDSPLGLEAVPTETAPGPQADQAPAYLQRLVMQDPSQAVEVLPLAQDEITIGSGSTCDLILDEPSVEKQHARLLRQESGEFRLADLGSHAGTWINYAPVSPEGSRVQDGDIVHIGRVAFRFLVHR